MSEQTPSTPPQFGTAEYESAGPDHCKFCNQQVGTQYYRVGEAMACGSCALRLKSEMPVETGGVYARGLLFGIGAALAGMALYAAVTIITGWEIGLVSLAVGWLVGTGMMKGSGGFGGRKYQLTAVALTYFAVSVAAIPIGLSQMWKQIPAEQGQSEAVKKADGEAAKAESTKTEPGKPGSGEDAEAAADGDDAQPDASEATKGEGAPPSDGQQMGLGMALLTLLLVGLASPFLGFAEPVRGLIGLVIIFVGLHIAWQKTAATALVVDGPFDNQPSADSATSGS
ncbi:MAG: hypothetical protein ABIP12_05600 [Terriglobales bacterium]